MKPLNAKIAVVGTGVIGASWAAYFLSKGYDVAATDPAPGAESRLRRYIHEFWPSLTSIGLEGTASPDRLRFYDDIHGAVENATFVQESCPERLDIKREIIAQIDSATPADAVIATSSSGLLISDIQDAAAHPERIVLGHPFNPPHLIPLVEVAGGRLTSHDTIQRAMEFYTAIGKKPIFLRQELKGYVGNRLQAALWREAFYLVQQGVVSPEDVDTAIAHGPGLRWALLGPFKNLHLSGGEGGIAHTMEHFGPAWKDWWADLGSPTLTNDLKQTILDGVNTELQKSNLDSMVKERDDLLIDLIKMKAKAEHLP